MPSSRIIIAPPQKAYRGKSDTQLLTRRDAPSHRKFQSLEKMDHKVSSHWKL
jgi:hypothetical protein